MPETDDTRARRGTIALSVASAVLAVVGVTLLLGTGEGDRPITTSQPATTASSSAASDRGSPAQPSPSPTTPSAAASASAPVTAAALRTVTKPMQDAARAFVIAWASHDARPGKDSAYDDASRRAADHAAGDLATDLRTRQSGSAGARQWLEWKASQVRVTASILRVSLPDGAPTPTEDSGYAQVLYTVTQDPATGPSPTSQQHVVLKLRRDDDGTWYVVGLPNV
jgi:hypothetical protein